MDVEVGRDRISPAGLMVGARLLNIGVGLLMVPLALHGLGTDGFGAWAVLLAASVAFSTLEVGMPATLIKFGAPLADASGGGELRRVALHVVLTLAAIYAIAAPAIAAASAPLGRLLQLPDGAVLAGTELIAFVYAASAARACLQVGVYTLYAARDFRSVAGVYLLQPFLSYTLAVATALATRRLDLTVMVFWTLQLGVLAVALAIAYRKLLSGRTPMRLEGALFRMLWAHGFKVQVNGWAQLANYQFDKFAIAAITGVPWVAPYEVANRSVIALGSIPSSGMDTFLPFASSAPELTATWSRYQEMNRVAAYFVVAFMAAPLCVAPIILYAWTGTTGYAARLIFVPLLLGAGCTAFAYPAATIAQAMGRAGIRARAAIASVAVNLPLSVAFVAWWGPEGGAVASAISMAIGAAVLLRLVHAANGWSLSATLRSFARSWPALALCAALSFAISAGFAVWLFGLDEHVRFARESRLTALGAGILLYAACAGACLEVQLRRTGLSQVERAALTSMIRFPWFARYCDRPVAALDGQPVDSEGRRGT